MPRDTIARQRGVQNKKYNGKEFIEAHGLDEYDSQARMYYPAIMRTTTIDPLAEKYYSISPYAWCGNNPVNRIDPDGRDITIWYTDNKGNQQVWIFNGQNKMMPKNEFVQSFVKAYNYNVKNGGGDNLKKAAFSKDFNVQIVETNEESDRGDMEVTRNGRTHNESMVSWNPNLGLETEDGKTISPATILEHETDHEVDYQTNTERHIDNQNKEDEQYTWKEERRVITGSEAKTARANKEFPKNYVRPDHDRSKFIITPSVTSNQKLKYYQYQ